MKAIRFQRGEHTCMYTKYLWPRDQVIYNYMITSFTNLLQIDLLSFV